jgi:hypothetical protein
MQTKVMMAVCAALCALVLTGCNSKFGQKVDSVLFRATAFATNRVPERVTNMQTNMPVVTAVTNALGEVTGYSTNRVPTTVQIVIPAHDEVKAVGWAPNETTTGMVQGAAGLVPGYGAIAGWGLTALLGVVAHLRSKRYRDAAVSIAQGVEYFAQNVPSSSSQLKSVLKQVQDDDGTRQTVDALLRNNVAAIPRL